MKKMGKYCKAYVIKDLRRYDNWSEKAGNARPESFDEAAPPRKLEDESVVFLQENFIVTDGIYLDEHVLFDDVTDDWKTFCRTVLRFEVPVFEPIEIVDEMSGDA